MSRCNCFYDDFIDEERDCGYRCGCNPPRPYMPRPCPPPPGPCCCRGPAGPRGADGKSAYQVALDNGFIGTAPAWLASLKGATGATGASGPFLSSYMEALADGQTVARNASIRFDPSSIDNTGNNITINQAGTVFTISRPGLYHVEWSLNLSQGSPSAVVGILENGEGASGATSSAAGSFSSGTIIHVTTVPFTLSLHNYNSAFTIERHEQWENSAASIRIVRFADGPSV